MTLATGSFLPFRARMQAGVLVGAQRGTLGERGNLAHRRRRQGKNHVVQAGQLADCGTGCAAQGFLADGLALDGANAGQNQDLGAGVGQAGQAHHLVRGTGDAQGRQGCLE